MKQFKKNKSKLLAMLMTLMMVISMIPASAFAESVNASDVPFIVEINGEEMADIDESTLSWTDWSGNSSDVTCYTVTVPEGSEEATLTFDEEKQWSYYDSTGNYVGAGDTSWTSATEHTVAIQDSNSDGELDGISVQEPNAYSTEYFILFVYGNEENDGNESESSAPFTATVDGTIITEVAESTLSWTDWSGNSSDVTCYTVTVPEGSEEATLTFDEEKQWSYYDSTGNYVGAGDTSWTSATEHTVAIQDSNSDGELDGISVQEPNAYSTEYFILFKYETGEGTDEPVHEHSYDEGVITTEPTCNEPGVKTFTCSGCDEGTEGHSYTKEVAATGHKYDEGKITTSATCAAEGVKTYTCQNEGCTEETEGHTKTEKINKKAHTYDDVVVEPEPTCTEPGVKTFTCTVCDENTAGHIKTETIPAKGHERGDDTECDVCGDIAPVQDENGVYYIGNAKELLWFAKTVNGGETGISGKIIADIDLSTIEDWPGIGVSGKEFAGSFDGQNHVIKLNGSSWGVIGYAKGTEANHVQIKNIITEGSVKNSAIAQTVTYVDVDNCINRAAVGDGNSSNIAGIVGNVKPITYWRGDGAANITNCTNEGNVIGSGYVGGILGYSQNHTKVICCNNSGNISGNNDTGGIVGYLQQFKGTCKVENSYNIGKVSGNSATGGIVGNLYNGAQIINCYNAGESTYAITGNIYNNTVTIANTYYRGDLCSASVANITQTAGYFTGDRGTAVTSAEMSGKEIADALGDAFQQSCPSPVFTWQEPNVHSEDIVCEICKQGSGRPTEYKVVFDAIAGSEIVGDTTFRAGNDYTFKVNILDGYFADDNFSVYVNHTKVEAVDGTYTVEAPNGPFYISVTGVKEYEGILPMVLPEAGNGYRVNPCEGYETTVESGKDFKFTVDFVEGFKAGNDFIVKSNNEKITPDSDGVYTIENVLVKQTITVEGVDAIPGQKTVDVKFDCTTGENKFYVAEETGTVMMDLEVEVPYFDIGSYGLEKYYYNPNCYVDGNGNINGQQKAGTRETAYNVVTSMHAFIYITEVYYLGYEPDDAGTGLSDITDSDKDGKSDFDEAISWSQGVGSSFMNLWDVGTNLNYHINYAYPLAYPKWGSTSDQQALKDGDRLSTHKIEGSASGSAYGFFVVNDTNDEYDDTDLKDSTKVSQGEQITLTHYRADQGNNYSTAFNKVSNKELYWVKFGDETAAIVVKNEEDESTWSREGFGNLSPKDFKTDGNGKIIIDTTEIEPGTYFIGATGGFASGSGQAGSDGFVSRGAEAGPAYFKLTVEVNKLAEAKAAAKKEIAEYKDAADYREAQQAELAEAIEAANEAIDAAETVEAVGEAVAAAKAELDKIKTDAELDKEEADAKAEAEAKALAEAKAAAKKEIAEYKDAADYREAQQAELAEAIEAANEAIDAAETVEAVGEAVAAAKAELDKIKTDTELDKEEADAKAEAEAKALAEAKAAAKKEIAEYKDAADYREAQQAELAEAIEAANEAIDAAETVEAVGEAVAAAKAELDKIKTDTELDKEEADAEAKTTTHQDKLDSNYLEGKEELKSAGFDSVEKIKTALIEKIEALVEYQASEENTAFLEIMLVYEGTETPVDKEHFPEEGLDIYINYAKIFDDENVDYSKFNYKVVHMFSIDTNGHKAGEIEVLDAEVTENGLKVHVEGLSPFAISYEEKTSTEPDQPNDPTGPEEPNDPVEPEDPTNPEAPVDPTEPKNPVDDEQQTEDNGLAEDNDDSAKTGDDFEPIMLLTIMLIAGAVAVGIRRREY